MKKLLSAIIMSSMLVSGGLVASAQDAAKPKIAKKVKVSKKKHPNIAAAQKLIAKAALKITAAQKANEWDMDGHAAKAKDLLDQATAELKAAAEAANANADAPPATP